MSNSVDYILAGRRLLKAFRDFKVIHLHRLLVAGFITRAPMKDKIE